MPSRNAVVAVVARIDREQREVAVELADGQRLRLDPEDRRSAGYADLLAELGERGHPVYVEVDPDTSYVVRLLIPLVARVLRVDPRPDGSAAVMLDPSHAVHVLPAAAEDSVRQLLDEARESGAEVVLSEDDAHRIVDVRLPSGPVEPRPRPEEPVPPFPGPVKLVPKRFRIDLRSLRWIWPAYWFSAISRQRAFEAFDAVAAKSCDPLTAAAPCIPFLYPDNGCWARAHEMIRLMQLTGLAPRKVWNFESPGNDLVVKTANSPACEVKWWYHVAPTLRVRWIFPFTMTMVIDPALFSTPVPTSDWKNIQSDANSTLEHTDWTKYGPYGGADPNFTSTNLDLDKYRLALKKRAIDVGPPPYDCP